jgi:predicted anti-sigma-YlaC factor YlaD
MDCEWVGLLLVDHLDGACIDPLREKIDRHLAGCAACRAEREALAGVDDAMARARVPDPPGALADDVLRGALRPVAPVPRWRDLRSLAAAAAVLAGAVGLYTYFRNEVGPYLPDVRVVSELADAATRTGESVAASVWGYAQRQLRLDETGERP